MFLPFTIFAIGWMKPVFAIPIIFILFFCYIQMAKSFPSLAILDCSKAELMRLALIFLIILFWVYLSGIGGFVAQRLDHTIRNGIFKVLVEEAWPVYYLNPPIEYYEQPVSLVYYFGFWLPSAVIGKIFGLTAGFFAQVLWAALGIFLFYCLVIEKFIKKIIIWPLFIFIFFSGLDIVGHYLLSPGNQPGAASLIEGWANPFQFSSFTTQLFSVFNQSIPAWLATMLVIMQKINRFIALVLALIMINSTLPFIGLIPIAGAVIINNLVNENKEISPKNNRRMLRNLFTVENIVGGGTIGIISFLFLTENISSDIVHLLEFDSLKGIMLLYLLFIIVEVLVFFFAIHKYQKGNYLFYCSAIWLAICPWIYVGGGIHDFAMRASIPALVIICCLLIDTLIKSYKKKDFRSIMIIMILLILGSSTSIREFRLTTKETIERSRSYTQISLEPRELISAPGRNQLFGYIEKSLFFDYIAKNSER
jgi:hypothetical protein